MCRGDGLESLEIERKYEVDPDAALPTDFTEAGLRAADPVRFELTATYFDTPDGQLARRLIAVRHREGGSDAGWHLKSKGDGGAREVHWPPAGEMPEGLRAEIAAETGDEVVPLAELRTSRTVVALRDAGDAQVVELADDLVLATHHATGVRRAWREWEAELAAGADPALLDAIDPVLCAAGAAPSANPAKIVRATGMLPETDARDRAAARKLEA